MRSHLFPSGQIDDCFLLLPTKQTGRFMDFVTTPDVVFLKFHVLITTYECVITDILELREIKWRACVIDEAHRLKNAKCKLLDGLNLLVLESRLLLSGTPLQNNINELYSLLSFLEPQQFSSQTEFMKEFGDMQNEEQVKKLQVLLKPLMLRYNRYLTIAFFLQLNVLLITPVP